MTKHFTRAVHVTLTPETSLGEALRAFDQADVEALAVIDRGKYVGAVMRSEMAHYRPSPASTLSKWEMNNLLEDISIESQKLTRKLPVVDYKWDARHKLEALVDSDANGVAVMSDGQFSHIESWKELCFQVLNEAPNPLDVKLMQPRDFALTA